MKTTALAALLATAAVVAGCGKDTDAKTEAQASERPADVRRAVKKAVDAGLANEDALRALTISVAQIYGVDDRLGSLEPGKIGNLIVTDGDWLAEKTQVKLVFVDGKKFEPTAGGQTNGPA